MDPAFDGLEATQSGSVAFDFTDLQLRVHVSNGETRDKNVKHVSRSTPASYLSSPIITVTVNSSERQYLAHKDLLIAYSPFFEACLNPNFSEGQSLKVNLGDEDEAIVEMFLSWLYTGDLSVVDHGSTPGLLGSIIPLYGLADRLQVTDLKNDLVDHERRVYKEGNRLPNPDCLISVNSHDLLDSQFARFLLQLTAWALICHPYWYSKTAQDEDSRKRYESMQNLYSDKEASTALLQCVAEYAGEKWPDPRAGNDCRYHEHDNEESCGAGDENTRFENQGRSAVFVADDLAGWPLDANHPSTDIHASDHLDNVYALLQSRRSENRLSRIATIFTRNKKRHT